VEFLESIWGFAVKLFEFTILIGVVTLIAMVFNRRNR